MLQNIYSRFRGASLMLLQKEQDTVTFVGTAVLVHPAGYLLTASHILYSHKNLMVAPSEVSEEFVPTHLETVAPYQAVVQRVDEERGLALLKLKREIDITMPDHVLGVPSEIQVGSSVACLGYSFGFYHIYNQLIQLAVVSARIISRNHTRLFLFDTMTHEGTRGGPLINVDDGRIIGIIGGKFKPHEAAPAELSGLPLATTNISYAISIEYGIDLMEKEGLNII